MTGEVGGVPVIGRGGDLVGDQLDMTLRPGESPPKRRRQQGPKAPGCTTPTPDGWCDGQMVAKPGARWVCCRCGVVQSASDVARRKRW